MSLPLDRLVADNLDIWTSVTERKSGAGRGGGKRVNLYGIKRLRALILDLAVRGKLVPQDAGDEPAAAVLPKIAAERQRRIKAKEIKVAKGPSKPTSEPFEVPPGWVWLPLWQTGNIFTGNSINPSLRVELEKNGEGRPFVATKDVGYGFDPIDYDNGLTVELEDQRFSVAKPNSVFICAEGGSAGRKMAISDREISFGNKLIANEPWSQIVPRFILYTYLSDFFFDSFSKEMTGIIGGISRAKFLALPFPLPPLAEQRRIVVKVDELMALCDELERESADALAAHAHLVEELLATLVNSADAEDLAANWARLDRHFDTLFTTDASIDALKQTVLDLAVRGKLVEQDAGDEAVTRVLAEIQKLMRAPNLGRKPVDEIEGSKLPFPIPTSWLWVRLGSFARLWNGYAFKSSDFGNDGVPVIRIGDLKNGEVDTSDSMRVSENVARQSKPQFWIPENALLIAMSGATTGKTAFNSTGQRLLLNQRVGMFELFLGEPKYLRFFLETKVSHNLAISSGSAIPNLSAEQINSTCFPLPPLAEQRRIVAKVDELMALCDALKARIADAATTQRHLADAVVERAAA